VPEQGNFNIKTEPYIKMKETKWGVTWGQRRKIHLDEKGEGGHQGRKLTHVSLGKENDKG